MTQLREKRERNDPPVRKLSNLILYSSLWISACAAALVTFTYDVTGSGEHPRMYAGFVFCGTLVLYTVHRLVGLERVKQFRDQGRFAIIEQYKSHILLYGFLGAVGGLYFLIHLSWTVVLWLLLPAFVSMMYVVPLGKYRRWRDYPMIKIFLIAAVWSLLTGVIPYVQTGMATLPTTLLVFGERASFIFALTIPFDIRDIYVDKASDVPTIPSSIGIRGAKVLALAVMMIWAACILVLIGVHIYQSNLLVPFLVCWLIAVLLIWNALPGMDDHYYSGLVDGMMFLLAFLYWVWAG
jgi:4-hydroxybenzoate polyprenyltransferase